MDIDGYLPGRPCWVDIGSHDIDRAAAFYSGLFGWEISDPMPGGGGYRMAELRGRPVAGLGPQMNPGPPTWSMYISVADADATADLVTANGGAVLAPPFDIPDVGRMGIFMDTCGAVFSVWQARAHKGVAVAGEHGTLCWAELSTRDTEAPQVFYRAVFGWNANTTAFDQMEYTEWQISGEGVAGMMRMGEGWPAEVPPHWEVYFLADDCDATVAAAVELAGTVVVPATDIPPGRFAVLADPNGGMFSILTPKS
jgi:predicted enzyme related to lactoylglutathione lyase